MDQRVEIQEFGKITDHLSELYGIDLKIVKENWKITTFKHLDLETLAFLDRLCPKTLPGHYMELGVPKTCLSVSKSNRLHVTIDLPIFLYYLEASSIDSFRMIGDFLKS